MLFIPHAGDFIYWRYFPGVAGKVLEVDGERNECEVVFIVENKKEVRTISFFAIDRIEKDPAEIIILKGRFQKASQ